MKSHNIDLKELAVLMPEEDYKHIMSLKGSKSVTREALCECGDIILTSLRRYC